MRTDAFERVDLPLQRAQAVATLLIGMADEPSEQLRATTADLILDLISQAREHLQTVEAQQGGGQHECRKNRCQS